MVWDRPHLLLPTIAKLVETHGMGPTTPTPTIVKLVKTHDMGPTTPNPTLYLKKTSHRFIFVQKHGTIFPPSLVFIPNIGWQQRLAISVGHNTLNFCFEHAYRKKYTLRVRKKPAKISESSTADFCSRRPFSVWKWRLFGKVCRTSTSSGTDFTGLTFLT